MTRLCALLIIGASAVEPQTLSIVSAASFDPRGSLAPDMIVIVGEVTRAWHKVGPIIKETVSRHSFTRAETQIVPSDPITQPRLRGTIALVLLKHFGAPAIA